jgi:saccharopine dehydrogenase-like NADP-dependent oxidoreductase
MKKKVVVLGAGVVGAEIAIDLCPSYRITVADINQSRLDFVESRCRAKTINADLLNPETIQEIIQDCDLVIGAMPGFLGFMTLLTVIEAGKDVVDISFFDEDPFELNTFALEKNVTAIVDAGVAPGMSNIILGYHAQEMQVDTFEAYVGGLPFVRTWPFQYKAPFSPIDVLEEYLRPARLMENGQIVVKPALSESEYLEIPPIGTLEAFNTDGLRTLLKTMQVPNMREKTLRYPGHIEIMKILRDTGFLAKESIEILGKSIRPIDFTATLLFPKWEFEPAERDLTIMQINITGKEQNRSKKYVYTLFDQYDQKNQTLSMARTTGYTCTAITHLFLENRYLEKGIIAPEFIGKKPECYQFILDYLRDHQVNYAREEHFLDV